MKAPERVLTTIEHREPDRVPAFESAFTNNTIIKHYGINLSGGYGYKKENTESILSQFLIDIFNEVSIGVVKLLLILFIIGA